MTKACVTGIFIGLMFALLGCGQVAKETAVASPPAPDPCSVPVQPLKVDQNGDFPPDSPKLKDDLQCSETEPNGGRFCMNGRFKRANYNTHMMPDGAKFEGYVWLYPDVQMAVNFLTIPKAMLTGDTPEKRAQQAEKIYDSLPASGGKKTSLKNIQIDGRPGKEYGLEYSDLAVIRSVYHDEDNTFYTISVNPTTKNDAATIQKALNSFAFVK